MNKAKSIFTIIITLIVSIFTIIVLSKKNDYTEVTANAYVASMGLDYSEEKETYTVYLYILNNFNISRSEYGTASPDSLGYICKGEGKSIAEALSNINRYSNIRLQYSHIRTLVLKDTFFTRRSILHLYKHIKLSTEFYPTFYVYTTSDDLLKIYNVNNFSETSAYYTILINNDTINKAKEITYLDYINDILISTYTTSYPILTVSEDIFYEKDNPITSIDITGYSYMTDDYLLSSFTFNNLNGLKHLNKLSKNVISYKEFDFLVFEYKLKKKLTNKTLKINITASGTFVNKQDSTKDYTNELIKKITTDLSQLKQTMDEYHIDVFNIDYLSGIKDSYLTTNIEYNIKIL